MRITTRAALVFAGLLTACSTSTVSPPTPPAASVAPPAASRSAAVPKQSYVTKESTATTLDAYKREVAEMLLRANAEHVYRSRPPELLYGVVVLQFSVGLDGSVSKISLLRVPPHAPELGPQAVSAVERASPFVRPSQAVAHGHQNVMLTESLLYRNDGKFVTRSLALPQ